MNTALFFQIFNLSHKNVFVDGLMVFGAEYLIYLVFFLLITTAVLGKAQEKRIALLTAVSLFISLLLIQIIRVFVYQPRPFVTHPIYPLIKNTADNCFPSIHTTIMSVIATSSLLFKSKLTPFFVICLIWSGFSRIFVGVHYPQDILGGVLVGIFSTFLIFTAKDWLSQKISKWSDKILSF